MKYIPVDHYINGMIITSYLFAPDIDPPTVEEQKEFTDFLNKTFDDLKLQHFLENLDLNDTPKVD